MTRILCSEERKESLDWHKPKNDTSAVTMIIFNTEILQDEIVRLDGIVHLGQAQCRSRYQIEFRPSTNT